MKNQLEVDDVVFYTDNGRFDTGIVNQVNEDNPDEVMVTWDSDGAVDWYLRRQLTFVKNRSE